MMNVIPLLITLTQQFYKWLIGTNNTEARCIGFSATPSFDDSIDINPTTDIISKFTAYNACIENDIILKTQNRKV